MISTKDVFARIAEQHSRDARQEPDGTWTITLTQDYDFPIAEVWECWTDPERLARWFGRLERVPEIGGTTTMAMVTNEDGVPEEFVQMIGLRECEEHARVVVDWGGFGEGASVVELRCEPLGEERTRVTVVHSGLRARGAWSYGAGWGEVLERARLALVDPGVVIGPDVLDSAGIERYLHDHAWDGLVPQG